MSPDPSAGRRSFKIPESVLVVVYTPALDVLLIRRADVRQGEFWQSVTGSKDGVDEALAHTAAREVGEETGIDARSGLRFSNFLFHKEGQGDFYRALAVKEDGAGHIIIKEVFGVTQ